MRYRNKLIQLCALAFILGLFPLTQSAIGCDLPVYRYAMRYWKQTPWIIRCFHKHPLDDTHRKLLQRLREISLKGQSSCNFILEIVDISAPGDDASLPPGLTEDQTPALVISYAGDSSMSPAWIAPLDETAIEQIPDSPLRKNIADRLAGGDTAVWIFLESDNRQMDSEKLALLQRELDKLETELKLPNQSSTVNYSFDESQNEEGNARVAFTVFTLSRSDPKEEILRSIALHTESDLKDYPSLPIVFPVYGRGRVLYSLVGNGVTPENIRKTAEFFIAPCTCVLKEANTGTDLLMTTDWGGAAGAFDSRLAGPLSLSDFQERAPVDQNPETMEQYDNHAERIHQGGTLAGKIRSRLMTSILGISAATLLLGGAFIIKRKRLR